MMTDSTDTISTKSLSRLVESYLRRFKVPSYYPGDKDDLRQVGMLGILKAIETWDKKKSNIKTWSWYWIRSFIRDEVSKHSRQPIHYIDPPIQKDFDGLISISQVSKNLNDDDWKILSKYLSGQSTKDIGKERNISRQAVEQRLARVVTKLKKEHINGHRLVQRD